MSDNRALEAIDRPQLAVNHATIQELLKRPLLALPPELRPAALLVWSTHKHLKGMESPLSLTAALSVWIEHHDLRLEEAKKILNDMLSPTAMSKAEFTSDVMTGIASVVATTIERRRNREHSDAMHKEYLEAQKRNAENPYSFREALQAAKARLLTDTITDVEES